MPKITLFCYGGLEVLENCCVRRISDSIAQSVFRKAIRCQGSPNRAHRWCALSDGIELGLMSLFLPASRAGSQEGDLCTQCSNPGSERNSDRLCTSPSGMNLCLNRASALPGPSSITLVTPAARQDCMQAAQSTVCCIWRVNLSVPARTSNTAAPSIPLSSRTADGTSAGSCALVNACRNRLLAAASSGVCAGTATGSIVVPSAPWP